MGCRARHLISMQTMALFVVAIFAASIAWVCGADSTSAQTPSPTPASTYTPEPQPVLIGTALAHSTTSAYQLVVDGPGAAVPGQLVSYTVTYTQLDPNAVEQVTIIFVYPTAAFSLDGVSLSTGAQPVCYFDPFTDPPQPRRGVRCAGVTGTGFFQFNLRVTDAFSGDAVVGFDVPGTAVKLPPGSVESFTTRIGSGTPPVTVPPSGATVKLPSTGSGGGDESGHVATAVAVAGAALSLLTAGALARAC